MEIIIKKFKNNYLLKCVWQMKFLLNCDGVKSRLNEI